MQIGRHRRGPVRLPLAQPQQIAAAQADAAAVDFDRVGAALDQLETALTLLGIDTPERM